FFPLYGDTEGPLGIPTHDAQTQAPNELFRQYPGHEFQQALVEKPSTDSSPASAPTSPGPPPTPSTTPATLPTPPACARMGKGPAGPAILGGAPRRPHQLGGPPCLRKRCGASSTTPSPTVPTFTTCFSASCDLNWAPRRPPG